MSSRGVLTLAFGKPKYIEMAKSLARSLALHDPELELAIVTDSRDPELDKLFTYRIDYRPEYGSNVRQKMFLDRYSPFDETIFVDSDSLVVRKLDTIWNAFASLPFGVCGVRALGPGETDEYLDVDFILNSFHLTSLPKFNGGLYYFNRSPEAAAVFSTARDLMQRSAELRFTDFRNDGPADEALYSVAMAIHGLTVTDMGIYGMWTPINRVRTAPFIVDIPNSRCLFVKERRIVRPDILHVATFTQSRFYLRQCAQIKHYLFVEEPFTYRQEFHVLAAAVSFFVQRKTKGLLRNLRHLTPIVRPQIQNSGGPAIASTAVLN